jgi:hypothetical protein
VGIKVAVREGKGAVHGCCYCKGNRDDESY